MSNRVIKDLIWTSPRLAKCSITTQLHFPRLVLLSDDWGCFNADAEVIKGLAYPKMKIGPQKISQILKELNNKGFLFLWNTGHHIWGCWNKWDEHNFSSGSEYNENGKRTKHRRKTPSPPEKEFNEYVLKHSGTFGDNLEQMESNLNPDLNHNHKPDSSCLKKFSDEDIRLTQLLMDLIIQNDFKVNIVKKLTQKQKEKWYDECRKLREIDGKSIEDIEKIIRWALNDDFWKANILSMPKLREKFDQLWLKAKKMKFSGIKEWLDES